MSSVETAKISTLPVRMRQESVIQRLDPNNTGEFSVNEAIQTLVETRKQNKWLTKALIGIGFCVVLLIGSIFGVSFVAANLAKNSTVDPETGFMYTKGTSHQVLKTADAASLKSFDPSDWTTEDFMNTKTLFFNENKLSFAIKGYSISPTDDRIIFLVEGGKIEFQGDEIVDVTGDARVLFENNAGVDIFNEKDENGRKLAYGYAGYGHPYTYGYVGYNHGYVGYVN